KHILVQQTISLQSTLQILTEENEKLKLKLEDLQKNNEGNIIANIKLNDKRSLPSSPVSTPPQFPSLQKQSTKPSLLSRSKIMTPEKPVLPTTLSSTIN